MISARAAGCTKVDVTRAFNNLNNLNHLKIDSLFNTLFDVKVAKEYEKSQLPFPTVNCGRGPARDKKARTTKVGIIPRAVSVR